MSIDIVCCYVILFSLLYWYNASPLSIEYFYLLMPYIFIDHKANHQMYISSMHWCFVLIFHGTYVLEQTFCATWLLSLDCVINFLTKHGWFLLVPINKKAHFMLLVFLMNAWYNHKNMVLPLFSMVYIIHVWVYVQCHQCHTSIYA